MKNNKRLYWILGAVLALLLVFAFLKGKSGPQGMRVTAEKASRRLIRETVSASGKIFPEQEIKISSDVSGEIVALLVKEGDSVTVGQLLARVNPDEYESSVERGRAGLSSSKSQYSTSLSQIESARSQRQQTLAQKEQAQAQLEATRATHSRNQQLHNEKIISDADFEASLSSLRQAEANVRALEASLQTADASIEQAKSSADAAQYGVQSSQASLKELNTSLRKTNIYAPVSGVVSKLSVEKGERVLGTIQMAGTEIMRIANFSSMEVQVDVNENDVLRTSVGDEAEIEVDAYPKRKFKGIVTEIANTASNVTSNSAAVSADQVTNFVVKVRIDAASYSDLVKGRSQPFRPGMSASVEIFTDVINDALSIPIQAVTVRDITEDSKKGKKEKTENEENIKEVVFVHSGDTVRMQQVRTGIQDDSYIQLLEGIKEGEEIITGPYRTVSRRLKNGKKISIVKEEELVEEKDDEGSGGDDM